MRHREHHTHTSNKPKENHQRLLHLFHGLEHRERLPLDGGLKLTEKLRQAIHHQHPFALHGKSDVVVGTTHKGAHEYQRSERPPRQGSCVCGQHAAPGKSPQPRPYRGRGVHDHPRRPEACRWQKQDVIRSEGQSPNGAQGRGRSQLGISGSQELQDVWCELEHGLVTDLGDG